MIYFFETMVIIGKKKNMDRLQQGMKVVPCTVVDLSGNVIANVLESKVVVGMGSQKTVGKQGIGVYKKLGFVPKFIVTEEKVGEVESGKKIVVEDVLKVGDKVTVKGISKGKGFAGVIKRWGMKGGPKTRGQGITQRHQGSIGAQTPGKVWKGKHMPGRMGNDSVKIKMVEVVRVEGNDVWLKGAIPGGKGSIVYISK